MVTSGVIFNILHYLHFPVDIRNICVMIAPLFSGLTAWATYLWVAIPGAALIGSILVLTSTTPNAPSFTREMAGESAGLLSAAFIGIVPGYISRSVAGSYDNEAIAIFLLMITFWLWIHALKQGSAFWGMMTAVFYGWMVAAWGKLDPLTTCSHPECDVGC